MPKRKCVQCKERFDADTGQILPVGFFHSHECITAYIAKANEKRQKKALQATKKVHAKQKREFYDNDVRTRKGAAKKACHDYVKLRDRGDPCICCGGKMDIQIHAGHWLESGNNPIIRYHEDNIHSQRCDCNTHKGGDSGEYEIRLRKKIGDERVDYLLENKGGTIKRTAQDYKEIEDYYRAKIKALS